MRALRLIFAAVATTALAGCVSYDDYYYAGERGYYRDGDAYYYRDDGRYQSGGRGYGDYWYSRAPRYYEAPPLYESAYYYRVLRPIYGWIWDPWYAPGWYYGVTYFPSRLWTSSWYIGWYSRPVVHYYSPWRYSWADNWYDWHGGYYDYRAYGYGFGLSHRDRQRERWRRSYADDYRHTYRDEYSTPRFGSAYNEAVWLTEALQPTLDAERRDITHDGMGARDGGPGRGPDGHDIGRVQRWAPAPSSGTVGDRDVPRWAEGSHSDRTRDPESEWRDASAERGYSKPVAAPEATPEFGEPEHPGRRWAGVAGRDYETTQPIELEHASNRWSGESRDYETVQPIEPNPHVDSIARGGSYWEDQSGRDTLYRNRGAARDAGYSDAEPEHGWRDSGRIAEAPEATPRYAEPAYNQRWSTRSANHHDAPQWEAAPAAEPRYEVREAPRFEPREEPRFEPREAPRFDPPSRDDDGRVERFDRNDDEPPY